MGVVDHAVAYDPDRDVLWLFGGLFNRVDYGSQLWMYSFAVQRWNRDVVREDVRPSSRHGHIMVYYNHFLYVFGGRNPSFVTNNELWRFDIVWRRWQLIPGGSSQPEAVFGHAAVVTPRGVLYIIGGVSDGDDFVRQMYEFHIDQGVWQDTDPIGVRPGGTFGHSAVYDGVRDAIVVFRSTGVAFQRYSHHTCCIGEHTFPMHCYNRSRCCQHSSNAHR